MNIYLFGSEQYTDEINDKLELKDISLYLDGEIIIIKEASELLNIIKSKSNEDVFLIDDNIIKTEDKKKSLFSFFKKEKFLIDEKDIEELASSTIEANSIDEVITKIMEIIDQKRINELDDVTYNDESGVEFMKDTQTDTIEQNIDDSDNYDDLSELSTLDEDSLLDALNDISFDEVQSIDKPLSVEISNNQNTINSNDQIQALTNAFEQLLNNNKTIKLTIEVCN